MKTLYQDIEGTPVKMLTQQISEYGEIIRKGFKMRCDRYRRGYFTLSARRHGWGFYYDVEIKVRRQDFNTLSERIPADKYGTHLVYHWVGPRTHFGWTHYDNGTGDGVNQPTRRRKIRFGGKP